MKLIIIAGMHRSGTSFVTELVRALGASTGSDLLEAADDNPHGFFENQVIKQLNDMVLGRLNGTWDRPPVGLSEHWAASAGLDRMRQSAETAINQLFEEVGDAPACVIKDPRFSLTLPFWNSVMAIDTTVVPLRSPYEVAQSLRHRNGFAPPRSAELWLRYTVDALLHAPNPVVVPLHDVVSDPGTTISQLASSIRLEGKLDEALELAAERERHWKPSEPFVSVFDHASVRLADAVFAMLAHEPDIASIMPLLERLASAWRHEALDGAWSATSGLRISSVEAAAERNQALQVELEDTRLRGAEYLDERNSLRRELRVSSERVTASVEETERLTRQLAEQTERLAGEEQRLADERQRVEEELALRSTAERQLTGEQSHREEIERQLTIERSTRQRLERRFDDEQAKRVKVQQRAADERAQAEGRADQQAKRVRAAERSLKRLRSRRSVRLATNSARPFGPIFRAVRRSRRSDAPPAAPPTPKQTNVPTVPSPGGDRVRKTYDVFPPGLDAETRSGLRAHLEANPILADTTVSIVMPTYNRATQIGDAIESVVAQTHSDWELLVIDDGSDDDTPAVVAAYAADERIRFVQNGRGGVSCARNAGLDLASGSVIAFLDTDNAWDPEFLALMVAELDRSGSPIGYSAMQSRQNDSVVYYRGDRFDFDEMRSGNYVDLNVLCHRRHLVDDGVRFDTDLRRMVDWDYLLEISRGREVVFAPFIGATYTLHNSEDQISSTEPYLYRKVISTRQDAEGPSGDRCDARSALQNSTLDFAICLAAPRDKRNAWGDHHFGVGLAQALERRGHETRIYYHDENVGRNHDVMISLRGLTSHQKPSNTLHVIWSISHPELLTWDDIDRCDIFFSASFTWTRLLDWVSEKPHHVLPQATDRARFHPHVDRTRNDELLFVGNSRQEDRPLVTGAAAIGLPLSVYGGGWHDRVPDAMIKGEYLPNEELSRRYASAGLVLNDHWDSMRDFGYVSNRTFDVVASSGVLLSDHIPSLDRLFGDWVSTIRDGRDLEATAEELVSTAPDRSAATWVLDHHSFDNRVDSILAHIEQHLIGGVASRQPSVGNPTGCPCAQPEAGPSNLQAGRSVRPIARRGSARRLRVAVAPQTTSGGFTSSAYIRLVQPLTSEIDGVDLEMVRVDTDAPEVVATDELEGADVFVVSRTALADASTAAEWLDAAEKLSIPVVLDIDDGFHRMDTTHPEFLIYQERIAALQSVITRSAEIWCSTESLADTITATEASIKVIPNSIDPRLWRRYRPLPYPPQRAGDHGLEILYAGTATHGSDFDSMVSALDELAQQTQFRLTVIGVAPQLVDRPWLRRMTPGEGGQYPKYATWMRDTSSLFDVGIAPLVDNEFNRLKSDVKLLEYLALDLIPVASDVGPYTRSRSLAVGGLCTDGADWVSRLSELAQVPGTLAETRDHVRKAREAMWIDRNAASTGAKLAEHLVALAGVAVR